MEWNDKEESGVGWSRVGWNEYATPLFGYLKMELSKITTPLFGKHNGKEWNNN